MPQATLPGSYRPARPSRTATFQEFRSFVGREVRGPRVADHPPAQCEASRGAVLVIPTLLHGDQQTRELRAAMSRAGYAAFGWELGPNLGPTPRLVAGVEARLLSLAGAHGPVSLVGLSMGGLFSRWLAFRNPGHVLQVITVCSPFRAPLDSFFLPLRLLLKVWPLPNLAVMAEELAQPLPVPGTCIYSERDGIVAWQSCCDAAHPEDCFAVDTPHVAIASDPGVQAIVLERLARQFEP